jgi:hypothetical protein
MLDELDKNLQSLFYEKTQELPEEPFIGNLLKRIQRRRFLKIILQMAPLPLEWSSLQTWTLGEFSRARMEE